MSRGWNPDWYLAVAVVWIGFGWAALVRAGRLKQEADAQRLAPAGDNSLFHARRREFSVRRTAWISIAMGLFWALLWALLS